MKNTVFNLVGCLALSFITSAALAGDANRGKRIAEQRCEACHIIGPGPRGEVAEAPPFTVIARKFGYDADMMVYALVGPHAKMNFSLNWPEADDVAAYLATLDK